MDGLWIYVPVLAALAVFAVIRLSKASPSPAPLGPDLEATAAPQAPQVPTALMSRFMSALPDPGVRQRLLARERTRFPGETETGLIERVLFTLEKDRT